MATTAERTEVAQDVQDGLFDEVIENDELAAALEERQALRAKFLKAKAEYEEAHETAKGQIDALALDPDTTARCGRFRIRKGKPGDPKDVAFTTTPKPRVTISLLDAS